MLCLQITECHSSGINLTLPSHPGVIGTIWKWEWFSAGDVNVIGLEIYLEYTTTIDGDPFRRGSFLNLKYLRMNNLRTSNLPAEIFEGLLSLEVLIITNATIRGYSDGMLEFFKQLNTHLKSFSLIEQRESESIPISSFIGGSTKNLTKLGYVKIQYNLSIIDNSSLAAIPFVEVLDLSKCYIVAIREHSFDIFGSNLRLLNLEQNKLTTLPTGLFSELHLTSINLQIRLFGNPWHCDCSLAYVQELLFNYPSFTEDVSCASPESGVQIKHAELCASETTTEITSETTPINEIDDGIQPLSKECHAAHTNITISPKTHDMQLISPSGQNPTKLELNRTQDMLLIWFGSEIVSATNLLLYQHDEVIDCAANLTSVIELTNLKAGVTYTFCLMSTIKTTVSPLNCLSYHHREIPKEFNGIWVYDKSKATIISVTIVTLVVAMVSGFYIGTFLSRRAFSFGRTDTTTTIVGDTVHSSR